MSIDYASSNAVNDAIIRLYLYGDASGLTDYASEAVIRPDEVNTNYPISAQQFKDGPGRFAMPELFELVRLFFDETLENLSVISGKTDLLTGERRITKKDLIEHYIEKIGITNSEGEKEYAFGLAFNQAIFDDGKDDYFQRVFIWGTTSFRAVFDHSGSYPHELK